MHQFHHHHDLMMMIQVLVAAARPRRADLLLLASLSLSKTQKSCSMAVAVEMIPKILFPPVSS
jgi:hypothetical protein